MLKVILGKGELGKKYYVGKSFGGQKKSSIRVNRTLVDHLDNGAGFTLFAFKR